MKTFACGEVVPDCPAVFSGPRFEELLHDVADHARSSHGLQELPPQVVEAVRLACDRPEVTEPGH